VHRVAPSVIIASYREPFMSKTPGEDVRMTIDREISYQPARGPDLGGRPGAWVTLRGPDQRSYYGKGRALIELKFRGTAPAWMGEAVARFDLRREAFSKYASAVAHLKGLS
jgi:VTC domain